MKRDTGSIVVIIVVILAWVAILLWSYKKEAQAISFSESLQARKLLAFEQERLMKAQPDPTPVNVSLPVSVPDSPGNVGVQMASIRR